LNIETLVARVEQEETEELVFALNPNIQGDTTIYYIQKRYKKHLQGYHHCKGYCFWWRLEICR